MRKGTSEAHGEISMSPSKADFFSSMEDSYSLNSNPTSLRQMPSISLRATPNQSPAPAVPIPSQRDTPNQSPARDANSYLVDPVFKLRGQAKADMLRA